MRLLLLQILQRQILLQICYTQRQIAIIRKITVDAAHLKFYIVDVKINLKT